MFILISILSFLSSIILFPYIDVVLLLITVGIVRNMDSKYFILGFILAIVLDLFWGRVFGLSFVIYSVYLYIASYLFLKYPIMRDYGLVIFVFGYSLLYTTGYAIFEFDLFLWKEAFIWIFIQVAFSFICLMVMSLVQRYRKNRNFLTTKSVKF